MIELFAADTPNGKKISIMLEEINFEYTVKKVNLLEGEQFNPEFRKISPFSKIPVIVDHANNKEAIFESGAILIYLGEKSNKFYQTEDRLKINQWLMAQMGYVGPIIGQHHQFHHYNPGKSKFGEERYFKITKSIYKDLDERLEQSKFLAGKKYSTTGTAVAVSLGEADVPTSSVRVFLRIFASILLLSLSNRCFCVTEQNQKQ